MFSSIFNFEGQIHILQKASQERCKMLSTIAQRRSIGSGKLPCVETSTIHLWELLSCMQPDLKNDLGRVNVENTLQDLLELIPDEFRVYLSKDNVIKNKPPVSKLRDIVFDIGRRLERNLAWMTAFEKRGWVVDREMKLGSKYFNDDSFRKLTSARSFFFQ